MHATWEMSYIVVMIWQGPVHKSQAIINLYLHISVINILSSATFFILVFPLATEKNGRTITVTFANSVAGLYHIRPTGSWAFLVVSKIVYVFNSGVNWFMTLWLKNLCFSNQSNQTSGISIRSNWKRVVRLNRLFQLFFTIIRIKLIQRYEGTIFPLSFTLSLIACQLYWSG